MADVKQGKLLNILSWNAQGITHKIHELELFMQQEKIDIALIQETKLNKKLHQN